MAANNTSYVHAALLLHVAGKPVDAKGIDSVLSAAGIIPEPARVEMLVASLAGKDIDALIAKASIEQAAVVDAPAAPAEIPAEPAEPEPVGFGPLFD
jgi:large subunit ribosomal protein L12